MLFDFSLENFALLAPPFGLVAHHNVVKSRGSGREGRRKLFGRKGLDRADRLDTLPLNRLFGREIGALALVHLDLSEIMVPAGLGEIMGGREAAATQGLKFGLPSGDDRRRLGLGLAEIGGSERLAIFTPADDLAKVIRDQEPHVKVRRTAPLADVGNHIARPKNGTVIWDSYSAVNARKINKLHVQSDRFSMAGGPGFEPRLTESESAVLPLNYPPTAARTSPG